jgi:hypothetical protein
MTVTLRMLNTERLSHDNFTLTPTTTLTNRFGTLRGFAEFSIGEIVEIEYDAQNMQMSSLSVSGRADVLQFRGTARINEESQTLTAGNDSFSFNRHTLILNQNDIIPIGDIGSSDIITIVTIDRMIWCIRLDAGHGFLTFENTDRIVNGTVTAGAVYTSLEGANIALPEGTHRVIVEGRNIVTFYVDVPITQGGTRVVNLADVELLKGSLQLTVNEPDVLVYINDEWINDPSQPILLEYGAYNMRITKVGFYPHQQDIVIDRPVIRVSVDLEHETLREWISVFTLPTGAEISINGVLVGSSPGDFELEHGTHQIFARRSGFRDEWANIVVGPNTSRSVTIIMEMLPVQHPNPTPTPWPDIPDNVQPVPSPDPFDY